MDEATRQALRALPAVEEVLHHPQAAPLLERYPRPQVVEAVRAALEAVRRELVGMASEAAAGATTGAARRAPPRPLTTAPGADR